jgi:hypothetical protein
MPPAFTHVVDVRVGAGGRSAWVLLATEVAGTGYYLDENICTRESDGSWSPSSSCGSGFTESSLEELRRRPPRQTLFESE